LRDNIRISRGKSKPETTPPINIKSLEAVACALDAFFHPEVHGQKCEADNIRYFVKVQEIPPYIFFRYEGRIL